MKIKKLILLTSQFPFGYGEPFLETEIFYLAASFDEVVIVSADSASDESRPVPENCKVVRINLELSRREKIKAYFGKYTKEFFEEKKYLHHFLKIEMSSGIRNTILVSLFRAKKIKAFLKQLIGNQDKSRYVCYSYWCSDSALALALLRDQFPEIKAVSRAHGWDLYFEATALNYLPFRKKIVEGISNLYTISTLGHDYVLKRWGVNSNNVKVSRLGTSPQLKIASTSTFVLVSCSNIIPLKRVELIAQALSEINTIEIEWIHFGGGDSEVLDTNISAMSANITVKLMGNTPNKDVIKWYQKNHPDLFINVSTTEGIPVSIMEAMSFGIPIIATNVGGTGEIVNNTNGYIINPDITSGELASTIYAFYELSENEREQKRMASLETWKNQYNAEKNYSEFAKFLLDE